MLRLELVRWAIGIEQYHFSVNFLVSILCKYGIVYTFTWHQVFTVQQWQYWNVYIHVCTCSNLSVYFLLARSGKHKQRFSIGCINRQLMKIKSYSIAIDSDIKFEFSLVEI